MGSSKKKSVVGYKYFVCLHFAICHGPINAIRKIVWADKTAWEGNIANPGTGQSAWLRVDNQGLFGGNDSEGGVKGWHEIGFGSKEQRLTGVGDDGSYDVLPIYAAMGTDAKNWHVNLPDLGVNYRGLATVLLHDNYIGNNAYLKEVSFEVSRFWDGWQPALSQIGMGANPAHIIYECLTNPDWGLGYSASTIDEASFTATAQTLYNENFALSFVWDDDSEIYDFIDSVKSCINAVFFLSRRTGKWTLRLIRAGASSVLTVDPTNATLSSFTRKTMGETYNEIITKFTNPDSEEYETVTVQDPANIEAQGRVMSATKEYVGVRDANLAIQLAERDLQVASAQLCTVEIVVNREGWALAPGDNITMNWPPLGISGLVLRVDETTEAAPGDDTIKVRAVEDVFSRSSGSFAGSQAPGWVNPAQPATLFPYTRPWEFPYWYVLRESGIAADSLPRYAAYGTDLAAGGNDNAKAVMLYSWMNTESGNAWTLAASGPVTPKSALQNTLAREFSSTMHLNPTASYRLVDLDENSFAVITDGTHEEVVQVSSYDRATSTMTINRGLMDTHPLQWPAGTLVYFVGNSRFVPDITQRSMGEVVQFRPAMQTAIDQMAMENVPIDTMTLRGRYELPYSVANVKVDGQYWRTDLTINGLGFDVTWSNRNRLLQDAAEQIAWNAGDIVIEDGTTVTIELWRDGTRVRQYSGLTGNSFTVPVDGLSTGAYTLRMYTVRDARENYSTYEQNINITVPARDLGYGNSYGFSYGG